MTDGHVVLVGMMGSGKTTVGRLLSSRMCIPFVDADQHFQDVTGQTIPEFMAARGEAHFRVIERDLFAEILGRDVPHVIATGGGVIIDPSNRLAMRSAGRVVWLDAPIEEIIARVGSGHGRPMLSGNAAQAARELARQRRQLYAATAHHIVETEGYAAIQTATQIAELIASSLPEPELETITVQVPGQHYDVIVGPGATERVASLLPSGVKRVAVVTQAGVPAEVDLGCEQRTFLLGDGEAAKTLSNVEKLCSEWAAWGLTRGDAVVAIGGGVVTDTAGFAAAIYHRGIPVVYVSTTLLGQVDAAIGGKTGVNLEAGKNLVGAFWQPRGVICDTDVLLGLPAREFRSGMGELAKYHFLGGEHLEDLPLPRRVAEAVRIKASVVAEDEREGGRRAILNYGHTLAHALEINGSFDLRHGEAVGIGLIYAAELAYQVGRIDAQRVLTHRSVVEDYGLSCRLPAGCDPDVLVDLMGRDKKAIDGLTFVLDGPDGVEPVTGIARSDIDAAFGAVGWER